MAVWAYVFLPETRGYALENVRWLFEDHVVVRAMEDAPGGKVFLRSRKRATPVEVLKARAEHWDVETEEVRTSRSVDEKKTKRTEEKVAEVHV